MIIVLVVNFKYFIDTNHHVKHLNTHISKLSESNKQLNDKYKNTSYKLNKMKEYNNTTALNIIKSTENIQFIGMAMPIAALVEETKYLAIP